METIILEYPQLPCMQTDSVISFQLVLPLHPISELSKELIVISTYYKTQLIRLYATQQKWD